MKMKYYSTASKNDSKDSTAHDSKHPFALLVICRTVEQETAVHGRPMAETIPKKAHFFDPGPFRVCTVQYRKRTTIVAKSVVILSYPLQRKSPSVVITRLSVLPFEGVSLLSLFFCRFGVRKLDSIL